MLFATACGSVAKPRGWSAVRIEGATIFASIDHGKLTAYQTGANPGVRWEFPKKDAKLPLVVSGGNTLAAPENKSLSFEGLYGDPVVSGDSVYVTAYSGHVIAIDRDGMARWVAELPGRMVGGVLVTTDTVYAGSTSGALFALERESGHVRWRKELDKEVWSTPVQAGTNIVVATMGGSAYAFTSDGTQVWNTSPASGGFAAVPAVSGGRLFVGSFDKHMYALNSTDGSVAWTSSPADNWLWGSARLSDDGGTVYAGSLGGTVYAFDATSGTSRWTRGLGSPIRSRPALVNGILVVGTKDGRLRGLASADGTPAWDVVQNAASDDPTATRGTLYADLTEANGLVYATTEGGKSAGRLYELNVTTRRVTEVSVK